MSSSSRGGDPKAHCQVRRREREREREGEGRGEREIRE
jgi:hypothetical protein